MRNSLTGVGSGDQVRRPSEHTSRPTTPPISAVFGRASTHRPKRSQRPCGSSYSVRLAAGSNATCLAVGQNPRRPIRPRSAGSRVMLATRTIATPIAVTGPSVWLVSSSEATSVISAAATVSPLATMAGPARGIAWRSASVWSSIRWRSSL